MIGSMRVCRLGRLCLGVMSGLLLGLCRVPAGPALADQPMELRESLSAGTCTRCERAQGGGIVPARFVFRCPRGRGDDAQTSGTGRSDQAGFRRATARFRGSTGGPGGARRQSESGSAARPASRGKAVRWVTQAAAAINGEVRPTASGLRPGLALLVAELPRPRPPWSW